MLLLLSISIYAQQNVTKFLGIPVDGSKTAMIQNSRQRDSHTIQRLVFLKEYLMVRKCIFLYKLTKTKYGELLYVIKQGEMKDKLK